MNDTTGLSLSSTSLTDRAPRARALWLALLAVACGSNTSGSMSIGPAGGTVAIGGGAGRGAQVVVPAMATEQMLMITVRVVEGAPDGLPANVEPAGPVINFGPDGTMFTRPVTITLPTTGNALQLLTRVPNTRAWTVVPGARFDATAMTMSASVMHFSDFVPVRPAASGGGCVSPYQLCGGACVDVTSDPNNCNICGAVCMRGYSCVDGSCMMGMTTTDGGADVPCAAPMTMCGTACVNTQTNLSNCGRCDNLCPMGQFCMNGMCMGSACMAPNMTCAGICTDVTSSFANCGMCGRSCRSGEICFMSTCTNVDSGACLPPRRMCGMSCVNPETDPANCGGCGIMCPTGRCVGAVCM